jgi:hypothetical protein
MEGFTEHAMARCRQRGFNAERLMAFFDNADIDVPAGRSCRLIRISRVAARSIRGGETLSNVDVVVAPDGAIVTIKHRTARRPSYRWPSGRGRYRSFAS